MHAQVIGQHALRVSAELQKQKHLNKRLAHAEATLSQLLSPKRSSTEEDNTVYAEALGNLPSEAPASPTTRDARSSQMSTPRAQKTPTLTPTATPVLRTHVLLSLRLLRRLLPPPSLQLSIQSLSLSPQPPLEM